MIKRTKKLSFFLFLLQTPTYGLGPYDTCEFFWESLDPIPQYFPVTQTQAPTNEITVARYASSTVHEIRFEGASFGDDVESLPLTEQNAHALNDEFHTPIISRAMTDRLEFADGHEIPLNERLLIIVETVFEPHSHRSVLPQSAHDARFALADGILTIHDQYSVPEARATANPRIRSSRAVLLFPKDAVVTRSEDGRVLKLQSRSSVLNELNEGFVAPAAPRVFDADTTLSNKPAEPVPPAPTPILTKPNLLQQQEWCHLLSTLRMN
jgi:hypothetical protein